MSRRVLIITYYWPPCGGSGVQRWLKFAKYLPAAGWQPVIYTPENPEYQGIDHSLEEEIPPEAEIVKRPIIEPYGIYRKLMGHGSTTDMKVLTSTEDETPGGKSWKQRLSLWVRSNLFVPDPRVGWVRPSVRFLKKYLREHPVDVIVTTSPPQSLHLIGERLHRELGIPWIPDFRDPWTQMYWFKRMPFLPCVERRHHRLEQRVLDNASAVLTVTPLMQEAYAARTHTPVAMITNGYDAEDFAQTVQSDGFFNLVHTGLFPVDGNPHALWKVLAEKCAADPVFAARLRIRLAGKTDRNIYASLKAAGLDGNVVDCGYLDHRATVREQLGASVLLLPLRNDPDYALILPGKLFEYLAAGHPILGIGAPDGAMARVLADTGAGSCCAFDDEAGIRSFLDAAWNRFAAGAANAAGAAHAANAADATHAANDAGVPSGSFAETRGYALSPEGTPAAATPGKGVAQYERQALTRRLAELLESVIHK